MNDENEDLKFAAAFCDIINGVICFLIPFVYAALGMLFLFLLAAVLEAYI